jgi:hypothetical protein
VPEDPPPDDAPEVTQNPISEPRRSRVGWVIAFAVVGVAVGWYASSQRVTSFEVARQRSPDGMAVAVLMDVRDGPSIRGYRVCMQRPSAIKITTANCREVAFLGGVTGVVDLHPSINLVWTSPSRLEIRYANASSVHIWRPVFAWGGARYSGNYRGSSSSPVIYVQAVQMGLTTERPPPATQ